jgi:hypothetical protein
MVFVLIFADSNVSVADNNVREDEADSNVREDLLLFLFNEEESGVVTSTVGSM